MARGFRAGRAVVAVATAGLAWALLASLTPREAGRPTWHEPAPDFSAKTLEGERVSLHALRGDVVLVNFWATWCPPCRHELPAFQAAYESYAERGFTVVGFAVDDRDSDAVRAFLAERGVDYPVAMAPEKVRLAYGGVSMLPMSFLVDREGKVRKIVRGLFDEESLNKAVGELLVEPAG